MTDAPDRNALAADYVCGLLTGEALAEAERLMRSDAVFSAAVTRWRERLAPLDDTATPVMPSAALWQRIESGIAAPKPRETSTRGTTWWNSLPLWRGVALTTAAASLLLAVGLGFAVREAQRTPALVAVLVDGPRAGAVVQVFNDGRAVLLPLVDIAVPPDRALQVWTLPSRERGPVSVGLMEQARTLTLTLQGLPAPKGDQLFEITLEPRGGSPIGRPTGPILFKGLAAPTL